jgi:tripartite-type tricarboxylate transporter receptor subunit TctC
MRRRSGANPVFRCGADNYPDEESMDIRRRQFNGLGVALAAAAATPRAFAQGQPAGDYPSRPIRLIIPFAVGGGTDVVGREIGMQLTKAWGQSVVVENRAGGNSTIGLGMAAKSEPDGYTLTMITASGTVNVTLQGHQQPYNLVTDFAPITQITSQPYYLVINPELPVHSVKDLLALAKRRRDTPLTYGSSGIGGLSHLSGALLSSLAKVPLNHVPYKGGAPAMTDVMSGHIDMLFSTRIEAHALIDAGKLRALAVTTVKRAVASPELPTMQEAGVPGYEVAGWYGMLAPAHTPPAVIDKLNGEILRILKLQEVSKRLEADGSEAVGTSPAQFGQHIRSEVARWRKLITDMGIQTG